METSTVPSLGAYFLAWSPVGLVLLLALGFKRSALELSVAGLVYTFLLCAWGFDTPAVSLLLAGVDGVYTSLPLLLVVVGGILLSTLCLAKGSLQRIVAWFAGRVSDPWRRTALIASGIGNFMEGAGVIAEPVAAPMLRASGLSGAASAALSVVGYTGLMTLALGGIIVQVLSAATDIPVEALAGDIGLLSVLPTVLLSLCVPWIVEDWGAARRNFSLYFSVGLGAGLVAWATAVWVAPSVAAMFGGLFVVAGILTSSGSSVRGLVPDRQTIRDFAPFAFLILGLSIINLVPSVRTSAREMLKIPLAAVPVHTVTLRPLSDAYTYIFAAVAIALATLPFAPGERAALLGRALLKSWRPVAAMALFGAMGQMVAFSGYDAAFTAADPAKNLASLLARGTYAYAGSLFPLFVPLLGWAGTFLTGYGVASILIFGKFQVAAAGLLGVSPALLASALAVGASVGSVSSPFKIAFATSLCGAEGQEGGILRRMIPLGLAVSLLLGILVWILSGA
jgi:lactate permease